jgi:hypothetical protein
MPDASTYRPCLWRQARRQGEREGGVLEMRPVFLRRISERSETIKAAVEFIASAGAVLVLLGFVVMCLYQAPHLP